MLQFITCLYFCEMRICSPQLGQLKPRSGKATFSNGILALHAGQMVRRE